MSDDITSLKEKLLAILHKKEPKKESVIERKKSVKHWISSEAKEEREKPPEIQETNLEKNTAKKPKKSFPQSFLLLVFHVP